MTAHPDNPDVREPAAIGLFSPFVWLARGWRDLWWRPVASLFYGLAVTVAGLVILLTTSRLPYLFTAAVTGFLLVAPVIATGVYELSRQMEDGETSDFAASLTAWNRNPAGIVGFGLLLLLAGTAWQVISVVLVAIFYKGGALSPLDLVMEVLRNPAYLNLFVIYMGAGGILAALTFAISVVSVPMLVDRRCDLLTAMAASITAVAENPLPLALWASLIMVLNAIGFATALIGMIIVAPWLGHASWHAYRDLTRNTDLAAAEPA